MKIEFTIKNVIYYIKIYFLIMFIFSGLISCDKKFTRSRNVGYNISSMKHVIAALETYKVDFGFYPAPKIKVICNEYIPIAPSDLLRSHGKVLDEQGGNEIFEDTFSKNYDPYQYYTNGKDFVLVCAGPDMNYENLDVYKNAVNIDSMTSESLFHSLYDPTNGIKSEGNIIFTSKRFGIHEDIPSSELPYIIKIGRKKM